MVKKPPATQAAGIQGMNINPGSEKKRAKNKTFSKISKAKIDEVLAQACEYARIGKHGKTIELCTETLDAIGVGNSRNIQEQLDLLGIRIESCLSWLKREAVESDVILMTKLVEQTTRPDLIAKAFISKGRVQINQGQPGQARKTLSMALGLAKQSGRKELEAEGLYILWGAQTGDRQIETVKQAAEIYFSLGDRFRAGPALTRLAGSYRLAGRIDEARRTAHQALEICKETGNILGVGYAYNTLSNTDTDLVLRIKHQKLASQAFEAAGNLGQLAGTANNLGYIYYDLGLYSRAQRYYQKALEIYPNHFYPIANSIYLELELKELDQAGKHLVELRSMVEEGQIFNYDQTIMEDLSGRMAFLNNKSKVANKHFKNAIRLSREAGHAKEIGFLTWLGKIQQASGAFPAALKSTSEAVKLHRKLDFPFIDDHPSQGIWWQHVQALRAKQKTDEAEYALEKAYEFLLQGITSMRDEGLRRNYLNKIALNREVLSAWLQYGSARKLPKARRCAHLEIESGLREPFERLAEISLELNALHTIEEIETFLMEEAIEIIGGERVLLILERDGNLEIAESYLPAGEDAQKSLAGVKKYLEKARVSWTVQLIVPKKKGRNRIVAPLVAQRKLIGYLYTDMDSIYGVFDETDRDMLGMLANQGAVALENARTLEGLEDQVKERTAELQTSNTDLEQRNAELQIINSIQQGLAAELDFQAIIDLVGDKLRAVFDTLDFSITLYDEQSGLFHILYAYEHGKRFDVPPQDFRNTPMEEVIKSQKPKILRIAPSNNKVSPIFGDLSKCIAMAPIVSSNRALGMFVLEDHERENAFGESELRLLTTIAASLGTALENARLFDETQRLLKETDQRNAELALINGVQQALTARLDTQNIFEAVGEHFRNNTNFQAVGIYAFALNSHTVSKVYECKKGKRIPPSTGPINSLYEYLIQLQDTFVINRDFPQFVAKFKDYRAPREGVPRSFLCIPVSSRKDAEEVVLLILHDMDGARLFTSADVRLLETLASLVGAALERKYLRDQEEAYLRALERELEIGRDIQMSFLPSELPVIDGWEVEASLKAAREVAGDFYDVFTLGSDENICLVIGDVCDKGVGAALFMTLFRSLLRFTMGATNGFGERSPAGRLKYAVTLTNNYIADTHGDTGMFATIFFGLLDVEKGVLTYINAGHEPPVILGLDGTRNLLGRTGMSVGVIPDGEFQVEQVLMKPGDLFFGFTDGVPEMNDPFGNFFGKERLLRLLGNGNKSAFEVIAEINEKLIDHVGDGNQFDDITMMAVRRIAI